MIGVNCGVYADIDLQPVPVMGNGDRVMVYGATREHTSLRDDDRNHSHRVSFSESFGEEHLAACVHSCHSCGAILDEHGDPLADQQRRETREIVARLAELCCINPVSFVVMLARIHQPERSLEDIASWLSQVTGKLVSRAAIQQRLDHIAVHYALLAPLLVPNRTARGHHRAEQSDTYEARRVSRRDPFRKKEGGPFPVPPGSI